MADAELAKILIVEDEPFLRLTLGDHLRDRGFEIIEAENGQQGLELFRLHSPDLVTLDLRMSPVSGQEVLEAIRDIDRNYSCDHHRPRANARCGSGVMRRGL